MDSMDLMIQKYLLFKQINYIVLSHILETLILLTSDLSFPKVSYHLFLINILVFSSVS